MSEPQDMIMPMLREMQAEVSAFREDTISRLKALESGQKNLRSAIAGETVLSRILVGEYEERINALEVKAGQSNEQK